jgi:hypothetical protein
MPTVTLIGGPCDQSTINITQAKLDSGQLTCKGALYVRTSVFTSQENITFATSDAIAKATKGPSPQHATQAWTRWMHALAHKGPQSHRRVAKSTARVRRIARHR